jgi:hypothetical protein
MLGHLTNLLFGLLMLVELLYKVALNLYRLRRLAQLRELYEG